MVHPSQKQPTYPRRSAPACVTITRRGRSRSFRIRPWVTAGALGAFLMLSAAYLGATAYLIYRDDLLGGSLARQVEMQHAYEERIAALRSELDRIASRHVVATQGVEDQLALLLERQAVIQSRQSVLDQLIEEARENGVAIARAAARLPKARPAAEMIALETAADVAPLAYAPREREADAVITETLIRTPEASVLAVDRENARPVITEVQSSLDDAETQQRDALDALDAAAKVEAERLSSALAPLGIDIDPAEDGPRGGPFVPADGLHFVERAALLGRDLAELAALRRTAAALPLGMPVRASAVSSGFGYRDDPFLGRRALHAGLDFVAATGTEVRATAPGVVVSAGWSGGYGKMIEIRHANGVSTRYGHLSAVLVQRGENIGAGTAIGRVGSTGRSTGPHLHYETRRDGAPVDPAIYLAAGKAL
jgi:murein DD-endopeptidase MepM/ murein hydrolase activator NlpD